MICTTIDPFIKEKIKNLEILWCVTLSNGTLVYSDYERPETENPWIRLKKYCADNNLFPTKVEVIMFGAERAVVFEDDNGLDGLFIVRGSGRDIDVGSGEPGLSYKHLVVGLLRNNEDVIDVRKYSWPQNEFEKFEQTRSLTEDNAKLMFFKNDSPKKTKQTVQVALNGTSV